MMNGNENDDAARLFDQFISACTCKSTLSTFHDLCDLLGLSNTDHRNFYKKLKSKLTSWKAASLWTKLDKRASHRDYRRMEACPNTKVLIIGAGPCGLRMAIEVALMGAKAVVVEKRDRFSRNNVLHLWNFVIADLRSLGAKKFFGKFCAGSIEHISIRQLQCILLKVALLLGVEVHVNVAFESLIEPPEDQSTPMGWRCRLTPSNHPVSEYQFDALIGADGKRNTVPGFQRKEFRGKLAIAITANFINRNTNAEARVEEISGVAFIFNQKFFLDLKEKTGIDLENIVYYKDETHYFVMTAKKASLLEKGVLKEDYSDTVQLLSRENVDQEALLNYATEAANFSTNHQLPCLEYAVNHYGQADIAMFDFTSMFAAENACRAIERHGKRLFIGIVGDSLLEPFWPTGSGCARGFLGVFDAAWMIKSMASGKMTPLQVIAERESIYQLLSQTTPENLHKNHHQYSIDPNTRYPNLNLKSRLKPVQVKHLFDGPITDILIEEAVDDIPAKRARNTTQNAINNDLIDSYSLLRWCQRVLNSGRFRNVHVVDFAGSWRNGLAFCALIHAFRPTLLDFNLLMESDVAKNNQLAFDVAEKELGVPPVMTGEDMAKTQIPDKLTLVSYISQLYAIFRNEPLPTVCDENWEFCEKTGCYVRVAAKEQLPMKDNPFCNKTEIERLPDNKRQLNYEKLPGWVKTAAAQASESDISETSDSDGTIEDGSIMMWKTERGSCSESCESTDDEVYVPVCVKSLKRLYEGPRGYSVSPRHRKSAVRGDPCPDLPGLNGGNVVSDLMFLDDNHSKTLTQDDVENFEMEQEQKPDENQFETFMEDIGEKLDTEQDERSCSSQLETLTQKDVGNFEISLENVPDSDIDNIFKNLTQESVEKHQTDLSAEHIAKNKEEKKGNVHNFEMRLENEPDSDTDHMLNNMTQADVDKHKTNLSYQEVTENKEMNRTSRNINNLEQELDVKDLRTLTQSDNDTAEAEADADAESSDEESFIQQDVTALTKRWKAMAERHAGIVSREKHVLKRDTSSGTLTDTAACPQNDKAARKDEYKHLSTTQKTAGKAETTEFEKVPTENAVGDQNPNTVSQLEKTHTHSRKRLHVKQKESLPLRHKFGHTRKTAPLYRFSDTKVKVILAGLPANNESSTDDHVSFEMSRNKTTERESWTAESKRNDLVAETEAIDFKVAKRKFEDLNNESKDLSSSKKLDRKSSFKWHQNTKRRSYIDIMKDNHPGATGKMAIDKNERETGDPQEELEEKESKEGDLEQEGGLVFVEGKTGILDLGKTFSHLETSSSTDCDLSVQKNKFELDGVSKQIPEIQLIPVPSKSNDDNNNNFAYDNSDQSSEDEFFDAKDTLSPFNSSTLDESDIDDCLYTTALETTSNDKHLKAKVDDNIFEDVYTTASGSQLASRLQLVSVSEDVVLDEDQNMSSDGPQDAPVIVDDSRSNRQTATSET